LQFTQKLATEGLIHSRVAAADTNALANQGTAGAAKPAAGQGDSKEDRKRDEL
jgi:hypothetical protein